MSSHKGKKPASSHHSKGQQKQKQPPPQKQQHPPPPSIPREQFGVFPTPLPAGTDLSFLFVVNTLQLDPEACERDQWCVMQPPRTREGYVGEAPGAVFRWRKGTVVPVAPHEGHGWYRSRRGVEGGVVSAARWSQEIGPDGGFTPNFFTPHATYTVFRGWKFRPIVFMESDASVHDVEEAEWNEMFHVLGFQMRHPDTVSVAGARGRVHAMGRDADWVGKLVPNSYKFPYGTAHAAGPKSGGMSGPLALILGLMALSQPAGSEFRAFTSAYWRPNGTWHGPRWDWDKLEPGPEDPLRGVLVHVCCDEDDNPLGSTPDTLYDVEHHSVIIREGH